MLSVDLSSRDLDGQADGERSGAASGSGRALGMMGRGRGQRR
jgi:hypothetical protein